MNDGIDQNLGWDDAKSGGFTSVLEPEKVQAGVSVGSNCQAGVSSIASQVGSRSPGPR